MIVLGTLKAEKRIMEEYPDYEENTTQFGDIAKLLSKLGSVMLLDVMTEKDIEEYVYKKYKKMGEEDLKKAKETKKNNTVINKLKNLISKTDNK